MQEISGKALSQEIAVGKIRFYQNTIETEKYPVEDAEAELSRYQAAHEMAQKQLQSLYETTLYELGKEDADIFEMHLMLLSDRQYHLAIQDMIRAESCNAEYAVSQVGRGLADRFSQMPDVYVQARSADILDISMRLLDILSDGMQIHIDETEPFLLMSDDLSPSELIHMDASLLLGFVTKQGSAYSHTAILAQNLHLPALVQVDIDPAWDGHVAILDGEKECLYLDPSEELLASYRDKKETYRQKKQALEQLKGLPAVTKSGQKVGLLANISHIQDVPTALAHDAEGIGLFRSEFLFLNSRTAPAEEEQLSTYAEIIHAMEGKETVIRTLDLGADKKAPYLMLEPEEKPALGYRAIRICLERPDLFKTQLRALLRASADGPLDILLPMVTALWEVEETKKLLEECKAELTAENLPYGAPRLGVMIETPAAALIAEELAAEVDFFSIGTNDLTQYTLAIDRNDARLDRLYDPHHPAILRLIEMTVRAGHAHDCRVCICGELAADTTLTDTFLAMGIDALSVAPSHILPLKKVIREHA